MSLPEFVFHSRIVDFYERIRAGKNLQKLDEIFFYLDERSLSMTKKWIMDERFPWTIGKGWSLLSQTPPLVAMTLDSDNDRPGGQFLGDVAGEPSISYEPDGVTPQFYFETSGRLKTATYRFFLVAPNPDMISAMYAMVLRALMEGEQPPIDETHIIPYEEYGIGELHYSGSDISPNQSFLPNVIFARTLTVNCTYLSTWRGRSFGKSGFVSSIDIEQKIP